MKYNILITNAAVADLNSAVDYIEHFLLNPQAADDLLLETEKTIMDLAVFPAQSYFLNSHKDSAVLLFASNLRS